VVNLIVTSAVINNSVIILEVREGDARNPNPTLPVQPHPSDNLADIGLRENWNLSVISTKDDSVGPRSPGAGERSTGS
jgi:hypothetical protein